MSQYLFIIITLFIFAYIHDYKKHDIGHNISTAVTFTLLTLLIGLRFRVGADSLYYEEIFHSQPTIKQLLYESQLDLLYQPLWHWFIAICRFIYDDYIFCQLSLALIFNIALFNFIRNNTENQYSFLILIFSTFIFQFCSFEIQRQTLALALFLFSYKHLKNNIYIYILFTALATQIHESAYILLILPLFFIVKLKTRTMIWLIVFTIFSGSFLNIIANFVVQIIPSATIIQKTTYYFSPHLVGVAFAKYLIARVLLLIPLLLIIDRKNDEDRAIMFITILFSVLSLFATAFERLLFYIYPLLIMTITKQLFTNKDINYTRKLFRYTALCGATLYLFLVVFAKLYITETRWGNKYYSVFFPYSSIYNPQIVQEREKLYFEDIFEWQ